MGLPCFLGVGSAHNIGLRAFVSASPVETYVANRTHSVFNRLRRVKCALLADVFISIENAVIVQDPLPSEALNYNSCILVDSQIFRSVSVRADTHAVTSSLRLSSSRERWPPKGLHRGRRWWSEMSFARTQ